MFQKNLIEMDNSNLECTNLFEQCLLQARTTVCLKRLVKAGLDIEKHYLTFQTDLDKPILEMQENNLWTRIDEDHCETTWKTSSHVYKSRTEKTVDIFQ